MRILKGIILILLFLFELFTSIGMIGYGVEEYMAGKFDTADMFAPIIFIAGLTIVTFAELVRFFMKRKWIFLPMIYMDFIVVLIGITVGEYANAAAGNGKDYLYAGFTMTFLTVVMIVIAFLAVYGGDLTRKAKFPYNDFRFAGYSAEWYWDDIVEEYRRINRIETSDEAEEADFIEENTDDFYIYGCVYIAYLYVWLMKKGAIVDVSGDGKSFYKEDIMNERCDPAEYIYFNMDGKLTRDDISKDMLPFLDYYYERMIGNTPRRISYGKDYDEIVNDRNEIIWCNDFSWYICRKIGERLDLRYETYRRECALENVIGCGKFFSSAFGTELDLSLEEVPENEKSDFDAYVERCKDHADNFPRTLMNDIIDKIIEYWGDVSIDSSTTVEEFLRQLDEGELIILKPYGDEIAYILCFEADLEPEHGISIMIKGDKVLDIGYRSDAESPWSMELGKA